MKKDKIIIFQYKSGAIELRGDLGKETIWATLDQIARVFGRDKSVISRHLKNIYKERELDRRATVAKNATVQMEGGRKIERSIEYYNLDAIISVGYRVNSKTATRFRQWATKTLRDYISKGYAINPKVLKRNYTEFQKAVENIRILLPETANMKHASVVDLISVFADTWLSLDAYDKGTLIKKGVTKKSVSLTAVELSQALHHFKVTLQQKREASELFGVERESGSIGGIVGNIMQTYGGKSVYPTVEEKAAHLLYFMVKNHPFTDGNKRSGAYAFVWFLKKTDILNRSVITPAALTALTLFVAESNPKNKERMVGLILQLLRSKTLDSK